jgi:hypothetical protein
VPEIDLPPGPRAQASWRRSVVALAASLALVAVVGLLWFFNAIQTPDRGLPVAWAVAAHHGWVLPPRSSAPLAPLSPARLGADTYVPDLAAAKLRVVHVGVLPASGGGEALIVGYAGTRGCKVTLLVAPAAAGRGAAPIRLAMGPIRALAWAAGNRSYMVLAEGMPASRFHLIADSIRRASLERLPLDEAARTALADSRAKSRPCAA